MWMKHCLTAKCLCVIFQKTFGLSFLWSSPLESAWVLLTFHYSQSTLLLEVFSSQNSTKIVFLLNANWRNVVSSLWDSFSTGPQRIAHAPPELTVLLSAGMAYDFQTSMQIWFSCCVLFSFGHVTELPFYCVTQSCELTQARNTFPWSAGMPFERLPFTWKHGLFWIKEENRIAKKLFLVAEASIDFPLQCLQPLCRVEYSTHYGFVVKTSSRQPCFHCS